MSAIEAAAFHLFEDPTIGSVDPALLDHLESADRERFIRFGWGPITEPDHRFLHRAFEHHARVRPEAVAVEHEGATITYAELNQRADRIANELRAVGVGRGDMVGLFAERSISLVAAMFGVLKAGAAYVPQHAGVAPAAQLTHIINTTGMTIVFTPEHLHDDVSPAIDDADHMVLLVDIDAAGAAGGEEWGRPASVVELCAEPDDPCFVLFTSGTTGPPNGVAVTHANVANIVHTAPGDLGIGPGQRVGQILSIAFDMAEWEIHGALGHGATLVIRGRDIAATAERVDVLIATPSILASLDADRCSQVEVVAVAGEPCPRDLADQWSRFARFHNSCGPTETTIVNTVKPYGGPSDRLTIGTPTPNNTVYVLDANLRPLPIGEVGEMWAGGDCVTAGYLGNAELNADRYRPDPFVGDGRMMFRTRDLGRWTDDGELEHYGRTDDQVKVRGFRVELDSVSAVIESVAGCERAVALRYDSRNLIAFAEPATVDPDEVLRAVAAALPYYCVPFRVEVMDRLPRTDRGKIDKTTLALLARSADGPDENADGSGENAA